MRILRHIASTSMEPPNTALTGCFATSRNVTGIMQPTPEKASGTGAFSLPVPPEKDRDDVRQGAGGQFAWLGTGSGKAASPRPTHLTDTP
jgi:hypothetical protein